MKYVIRLLLLFLSLAYIVFVTVRYSRAEDKRVCTALQIDILDSAQATFISKDGIEKMLRSKGIHPVGRTMSTISPINIERTIERDSFIRRAICTLTPGSRVRLAVIQRIPLLRVMADNGEDYYIDEVGTRMEAMGYEADLPIVTGIITPDFARKRLKVLGNFLRNDPFWDSQVEQIIVLPNKDIDLIMRVGDQVVHFGKIEDINKKFRNLRAFYTDIMPKVGWHKYSEINVSYDGRVICKRKKPQKVAKSKPAPEQKTAETGQQNSETTQPKSPTGQQNSPKGQ